MNLKFQIYCLLILMCSCLDKIDLDIPRQYGENLIIQGQLTRSGDNVILDVNTSILSETTGFTSKVVVKSLILENSMGQTVQADLKEGRYYLEIDPADDFNVSLGTLFKLIATTVSNQIYESDFVEMKPTPKVELIYYEIVEKQVLNNQGQLVPRDFLQVFLDSKAKTAEGEPVIFKWDVINNYKYTDQIDGEPLGKTCYVIAITNLKNVITLDSRLQTNEIVEKVLVLEKPIDFLLAEDYYCTVVQQNIDFNTLEYFTQINELNERVEDIYKPPSGTISTNFQCTTDPTAFAYGYFYAAEQDTIRLHITPEEVGAPNRECPTPPSEASICPIRSCCDCLILNGAQLQKPDFWQ